MVTQPQKLFVSPDRALVAKITGEAHPALEIFPQMGGDQLNSFVSAVSAAGHMYEPLVVDFSGRLLDGRNRFAVVQALKKKLADGEDAVAVEPRFLVLNEQDEDKIVDFIIAKNATGRFLSESQRAIAAAKAKSLGKFAKGGETRRTRAAAFSISYKMLQMADTVLAEADPADVAAIEKADPNNKHTVNSVHKDLPSQRSKRADAEVAKAKKSAAKTGGGKSQPESSKEGSSPSAQSPDRPALALVGSPAREDRGSAGASSAGEKETLDNNADEAESDDRQTAEDVQDERADLPLAGTRALAFNFELWSSLTRLCPDAATFDRMSDVMADVFAGFEPPDGPGTMHGRPKAGRVAPETAGDRVGVGGPTK